MEYSGKLYGKIANKYISVDKTAEDFDQIQVKLALLEKKINEEEEHLKSLRQTMLNDYLETGDPILKEFISGCTGQINTAILFISTLKSIIK